MSTLCMRVAFYLSTASPVFGLELRITSSFLSVDHVDPDFKALGCSLANRQYTLVFSPAAGLSFFTFRLAVAFVSTSLAS